MIIFEFLENEGALYLFLPIENIIRKDLFVTELTVLQINMLMIIEDMKMKRLWGGGDNSNGK